ncbi:MAG: AraC family transcriptional regulator [Alistipes sp.]|nr:AraC family transcriptional regulator [Alistipes sp.]
MKNSFDNFLASICLDSTNIPKEKLSINRDLALIPYDETKYNLAEPMKIEHAIITVYVKGEATVKVNLEEYNIKAPALLTLMPGQIVESHNMSEDLEVYSMAFSRRFIDIVNIPGWQQQYLTMYNNPHTPLSESSLRGMCTFYTMMHHLASDVENPFRIQVLENLIRVFYYGGIRYLPMGRETNKPASKNNVVDNFMELVQKHYREERLIGFYADKLCITPKYLSKLVKETTGLSAGDWIERHVTLEARAMLQSSDMTIQQIATSLNFPNQSFFGKYFKRATGISPKQYRASKLR